MQRCQDRGPWQQKTVCVCVCVCDGGCTVFMLSSFIQALFKQQCVCVCVCLCVRDAGPVLSSVSVESRVTPASCDCCCCGFSRTCCSSHAGLCIHQSIITTDNSVQTSNLYLYQRGDKMIQS